MVYLRMSLRSGLDGWVLMPQKVVKPMSTSITMQRDMLFIMHSDCKSFLGMLPRCELKLLLKPEFAEIHSYLYMLATGQHIEV